MLKWILAVIVLLVVVVAAGGAFVASQAQPGPDGQMQFAFGQQGPQGKAVRFQEVELGDLTRTVSAPGAIEPETNVEISAQVSARIVALPFEEGDQVRAGDVVVRLDARDLEAALVSARAQLASSEAALDGATARFIRAQAEFERFQDLYDTRDVSKSDLDLAEADFLDARSQLKQAEQSIEIAKATIAQRETDLDNAIITTPMDGIVTALNAEVGETVIVGTTNNAGSIIMEIADLSSMLLNAQVDETNIAPVREGQIARIYINAYTDVELEGVVRRVGLKRQVGSDGVGFFNVEILITDSTEADSAGYRLLSGLSANTDIEVERFSDVVIVPSQSVLERRVDELPRDIAEDSPHVDLNRVFARVVYAVVENELGALETVVKPVSVGPSDISQTLIIGGLDEGERIVSGPFRELVNLGHEETVRDIDAEEEEQVSEDEPVVASTEASGEAG
ncbi:MAG: efflux RND transporter periplasmic adaptor subunit [Planctomycetota bacterium]